MSWPAAMPRRILATLGVVQVAIGIMCLALSGDEARLLPGTRDDDPFGHLFRMNDSGAMVWIVIGALAALAALVGAKQLLAATAAAWVVVGIIVVAIAATGSATWGWGRPSNAAWALAIASSALVSLIDTDDL